jgi:transcriptional regulator with XRE-family HTH domain
MKPRSKSNAFPEIGARLALVRAAYGLTQAEIAELAGVSLTTWNGWETGYSRLSLDGARQIRRRLSISLDYLFEGDLATIPASLASKLISK